VTDDRLLGGVVAAAALGATASAGGAYLPTSWGWAALGPAIVAAAALLVRMTVRVPRTALVFLALLTAFIVWTAASALWTDSVPRSLLELERDLVYVATVAAVVLLPFSRAALIGGTLAAICGVCGAGLVTRLFPDHYGLDADTAYRLARPLGYWNAVGALAAIGAVLAFGVVTDARRRAPRSAAAAGLVVLMATIFFTLSRGAWIALAAGSFVALAIHPRHVRFAFASLVATVPALAGVALCAGADELSRTPSSVDAAASQGHRLALELGALAALATATPFLVDTLAPRLPHMPRMAGRAVVAAASLAAVAAAVLAVAFAGRAYDAFRTPQRFGEHGLSARLLSASGQNRSEYWSVAVDDYADHPVLGSGAGTYELYWTRDRTIGIGARDAHSLYVEALAELGPAGLALLVAALAAPFLALRTARRAPLVSAVAGGYAVYLVHAAGDWDWELPTLTLAALLCGAALALSGGLTLELRRPAFRGVLAATTLAVAVMALVVYIGNGKLADGRSALRSGRPEEAISASERASTWAPWSAEAWRVRASGERARGDDEAARRSLRRAVAKDPRDWLGWYVLALNTEGAERANAVARVRRLNPFAPPLDTGLGNE
jgi:tetratricopeptide (TPR) repeat protein